MQAAGVAAYPLVKEVSRSDGPLVDTGASMNDNSHGVTQEKLSQEEIQLWPHLSHVPREEVADERVGLRMWNREECLLSGGYDSDGLCSAGCFVLHEGDQAQDDGDAGEDEEDALPRLSCAGAVSADYGGCNNRGESPSLGQGVLQVAQHLKGGLRRVPRSVQLLHSWFVCYVSPALLHLQLLMWVLISTVVWPWMGAAGENKGLPRAEGQARKGSSEKEVARSGATTRNPRKWKDWLFYPHMVARSHNSVEEPMMVQEEHGRGEQLVRAA